MIPTTPPKAIPSFTTYSSPVKVESPAVDPSYERLMNTTVPAVTVDLKQKEIQKQNEGFLSRLSGLTKKVVGVANKFLFLKIPSHGDKQIKTSEVTILSGSPHMAKLIKCLAQVLTPSIKAAGDISSSLILGGYFSESDNTIEELLEQLLIKAYINMSKKIQAQKLQDNPQGSDKVDLIDIIRHLFSLLRKHMQELGPLLSHLNGCSDVLNNQEVLNRQFLELSMIFCKEFFPEGEAELPVRKVPYLKGTLWSALTTAWFPALFGMLYSEFSKPIQSSNKVEIEAIKGGKEFLEMIPGAIEALTEWLPSLFAADEKTKVSAVALKLAKEIFGENAPTFSAWIASQMIQLSHSDYGEFWSLIALYLRPLLEHVFLHLATGNDITSNVYTTAIKRLLVGVTSFFNKYEDKISKRVLALKSRNLDPRSDEKLLKCFSHLSNDILEKLGLNAAEKWPLPSYFQEQAYQSVHYSLTDFLLGQYLAVKEHQLEEKVVFGESKSDSNKPRFVTLLSKKLADDAVESLVSELGIKQDPFLAISQNKTMGAIDSFTRKWFQLFFSDMAYYFVSTVNIKSKGEEGRLDNNRLLSASIIRVMNVFDRNIKSPEKFIHQTKNTQQVVDKKKNEEWRHSMKSLTAALINLTGDINPFSYLPLTLLSENNKIENFLWKALKGKMLPGILEDLYKKTMSWNLEKGKSLVDLEKCYHTSHPKWAVHVLSQYATDYTRHYLSTSSSDVTEMIADFLQDWLNPSGQGKKKHQTIDGNFFSSLEGNIAMLGDLNEKQLTGFWFAFNRYVQGMISKMFAGISLSIREKEEECPEAFIDIAIGMMHAAVQYLRIYNGVNPDYSNLSIHESQLLNESFIEGGTFEWHSAVLYDANATEEEKTAHKLQNFFVPISKSIFGLSKLKTEDFPFPGSLKGQIEILLSETIFPSILMDCFEKLDNPDTRNTIMLTFVENLYETLNQIEDKPTGSVEANQKEPNPKQQRLNKRCGEVVKELAKLIPDSWIQYIMMRDRVLKLSSEAIGEGMMSFLSKKSFLQLIDQAIFCGLPNLHPSKWQGKEGKERLVPLELRQGSAGDNLESNETEHFHFDFGPLNVVGKLIKKKNLQEAQKKAIALKTKFTKTISSQLEVKGKAILVEVWKQIQERLDDLIELRLRLKALTIKERIDWLLRKIVIDFLGTILTTLLTPLFKLIRWLTEKLYIGPRAQEVINNMQVENFQHLFYRWSEICLEGLYVKMKQEPFSPNLTLG